MPGSLLLEIETRSMSTSSASSTSYRLFAGCAPGLQHVLRAELDALATGWSRAAGHPGHMTRIRTTEQGVEAWVTREGLWAVCQWARLPEFVRVRVGKPFYATDFRVFRAASAKLPFYGFLSKSRPVHATVKAVCSKSKLIHSTALEQRVMAALCSKYVIMFAQTHLVLRNFEVVLSSVPAFLNLSL